MSLSKLEIKNRFITFNGKTFGTVGRYEQLEGTAHFRVSRHNPIDEFIDGLGNNLSHTENCSSQNLCYESFSADFVLLKPENMSNSNQSVLIDILNRGRKTVLNAFNSNDQTITDPSAPLDEGNGFLMNEGYSIGFIGWQTDVTKNDLGLMTMQNVPIIEPKNLDREKQKMLMWFQSDNPTNYFNLSHRDHKTWLPNEDFLDSAELISREHPHASPKLVQRNEWSFSENSENGEACIYKPDGFEPGLIYELSFIPKTHSMPGIGFSVIRDFSSFLKYENDNNENPVAEKINFAYAFGQSQSGRFLRNYLYEGANVNQSGKIALDGIVAHVAGGNRGEFNFSTAQPSKDIFYTLPDPFPFTDTAQSRNNSSKYVSLLDKTRSTNTTPKIMFTNTSAEYWRGDAALIHINLDGENDASEDSENVRRYHFSGTQHGAAKWPPPKQRPDGIVGQFPFNTVDYRPLLRACLSNLNLWVKSNIEPPKSEHPKFLNKTAVNSKNVMSKLEKIPSVSPQSKLLHTFDRSNKENHFPSIVSEIDGTFNEIAGVRLPDISSPLATYFGWNLRHPSIGAPHLPIGITGGLAGSTIPLPINEIEANSNNDPRVAISQMYSSKEEYLKRVKTDALDLIDKKFLLKEDLEIIIEHASQKYLDIVGKQ